MRDLKFEMRGVAHAVKRIMPNDFSRGAWFFEIS